MDRGIALFRQGNYGAALQEFQSAARIQPRNALIKNLIGITETKLGRIQQANMDYESAIRLSPNLEAPYKNLGFNYLNANDYTHAKVQLQKALALDKNDPFVHYYLALVYLKTSQDTAAIAHLKPAEPLIENDPDAAYSMAVACLRAGFPNDALPIIDAVEQRGGFTVDQEFQLAMLLRSKRIYSEPVKIFQHMREAQPTSWVARYDLAVALIQDSRPAEALPVLAPLALERPADERILDLLGNVYESVGKLPEALEAYKKAVAADPGNNDSYLDYTRLLMDVDRYDDAAALIQQGIRNSPDAYALEIRLGAIDLMRGENDAAQQSFQKAITEHPEIALGYVALAKAYMQVGKDKEAADMLSNARKKLARDFALEYVYGLVSEQIGNTEEAINALKNAEQMQPAIVEPHYQLGKLYMDAGDWEKARSELERVIMLAPTHAQAHYQLSRVYKQLGDMNKAREMQTRADELMNAERNAALAAERKRLNALHPQDAQLSPIRNQQKRTSTAQ